MAKGESRGAFVVDLGELELSEEAVERITRSIRKSVLSEIASIEEAPGFSVGLRPPRDEGWFEGIDWIRTRGIWVDIENLPRYQ
jgi:hypothetical protein